MDLTKVLKNNEAWAQEVQEKDPEFFLQASKEQTPNILWFSCSDSRIPPSQIVKLAPGDLFVHRNVANLIYPNDFNALAVLEFAVRVLKVKHIIVKGHYGCGGVQAALGESECEFAHSWLYQIRQLNRQHKKYLSQFSESVRLDKLAELNVQQQVYNICNTTTLRQAWKEGQEIDVHGWIYDLKTGLISDLNSSVSNMDELSKLENSIHADAWITE